MVNNCRLTIRELLLQYQNTCAIVPVYSKVKIDAK